MNYGRAVVLCIIALLLFGFIPGCQKSPARQEAPGGRITQADFMELPEEAGEIVRRSTELVEEFGSAAGRELLSILLADAAGVAVIPRVTESAFVAAGNRGTGLLLTRRKNQWSLPIFVSVSGSSLNEQIGTTSTDLLLVFRNPDTVSRLGKEGGIVLGAGLTAALGPIGASADLSFVKGADLVAYKRAEGGFVGLHVSEGVLSLNPEVTVAYYAKLEPGAVRGYYASEAQNLVDGLLSMDERSIPDGPPKTNARKLKSTMGRLTGAARR